tara:strand:- start:262 stop:669 length:408 start_codon:yes stop_codon:yes gene_type:complete
MISKSKVFFLKYSIPLLAILVIAIQLFLVNTKNLNRWKGGGYGMYSEMHYYFNKVYVPGLSVDSLAKADSDLKIAFSNLMLMPNNQNLNLVAKYVLQKTNKDSVLVQIWKPVVDSKSNSYKRMLINQVLLKKSEF